MTMQKTFFLAFLFCGSLFLTGALNYQDLPGLQNPASSRPAQPPFVPGPISLPRDWDGPAVQPTDFLDSLLHNLHPSKLSWLELRMVQGYQNDGSFFQAEGHLIWASDQKARLEWKVRGNHPSSMLLVSNGQKLQRTLNFPRQAPQVQTHDLPLQRKTDAPERTWKFLDKHGCTSFLALLQELRIQGKDWHKETGTLKSQPVVRLTASLQPDETNDLPRAQATLARIYLDGANLWPVRLEWLKGQNVFLEIDLHDPRINCPPSPETLAQLFAISETPVTMD